MVTENGWMDVFTCRTSLFSGYSFIFTISDRKVTSIFSSHTLNKANKAKCQVGKSYSNRNIDPNAAGGHFIIHTEFNSSLENDMPMLSWRHVGGSQLQ